jgi:5-methylcytosine-specific restriction enzyme A
VLQAESEVSGNGMLHVPRRALARGGGGAGPDARFEREARSVKVGPRVDGLSPARRLQPCAWRGGRCPVLVPSGCCPQHGGETKPWHTNTPPLRIRGRSLQRLRRQLFQRFPLCVLCAAKGITRVATIRDHVIPLAEGGADSRSNAGCQAICGECSDTKTRAESRRGQARSR